MSSPRAKASYRNVRLIIIVTLAVLTLCYPALIDTAAVHSERQLQRLLLRERSRNIARIPRATENSNEEDGTVGANKYCHNQACGWAVYNPYTRNVEYFMKNTCECPDGSYKCVRVSDDLSASAYAYRCRQNTTAEDIESPPDDSI